MFGIIALLSLAQAEEINLDDVRNPDVEEQSNNGNGNKGNGQGNGKGGNGQGKGKGGQGKGKGGQGKGGNGKGKSGNGQGNGNGGNGQGGQAKKPNPNGQNKANQGQNGNMNWKKYKEEKNIIFRPEFGVTTLNLDSEDSSVGGVNFGLSIGNEKTKRLKATDVGVYNRSRLYGSMATGSQLNAYDLRAGSVLGVKVLHAEVEAGFDLIRHMADSEQTAIVDYKASNGFGIPVQALFMSDLFKIKVGAEPRWYFDGQERTAVDWTTHSSADSLPVSPIGDEFAWTVGFRSGWFGLSYEQLMMHGGTQHTVLFGLQR